MSATSQPTFANKDEEIKYWKNLALEHKRIIDRATELGNQCLRQLDLHLSETDNIGNENRWLREENERHSEKAIERERAIASAIAHLEKAIEELKRFRGGGGDETAGPSVLK
ncbi:unnamed protein product [Ceutorhynchus assimilis]|uniref:Uncharacterized protein n=1 Tax=Ceutorhynchus assimilis TaxID=467358 RepID=A0A9N9MFL9_9CUCU|nr:unnamed protein product [Ceutorhynchus assimilis]